MGISVILRAAGAASGGEIKDIAGDGSIDNRAEAEAALALVGSSGNVVVIGGDVFDKTRLERIRDGQGAAPVTAVSAASASASGRLQIGTIRTSENIPAGSRLYVFIDGNPSGDGIPIPADRATPVTIPASTADGAHEVQYRIARPNMAEVRYTRAINIRPALATLGAASVVPPTSGTSFGRDTIRVKFTTNRMTEHKVRVRIGTHTEDLTVPAGTGAAGSTRDVAPLALSGEPRTWMDTGGTPARNGRYTVAVTITPLSADGKEGTAVNAGSVTIIRQAPRRSSGNPRPPVTTTTAARPPRL